MTDHQIGNRSEKRLSLRTAVPATELTVQTAERISRLAHRLDVHHPNRAPAGDRSSSSRIGGGPIDDGGCQLRTGRVKQLPGAGTRSPGAGPGRRLTIM